MVTYTDEIGILPQERERNENAGEDRRDHKRENETSKRDLKKQIRRPRLTTEQFQQHINADPKLKAAYSDYQALMDRQKQATERVTNTGYLGTLWGGITGDSGVDDLAKINEDMNSANTKFRNALDQNSGLSKELKQQLIGYRLGEASGVNSATSEASGDFSERAENYAAGTKAVRNTAIGAGLVVGAVVAAPTIAAVAGVGGGATLGGGTATMSTVLGASAGGAILMHPIGTGLNVVGEEGQVVYDALKKDQTKTFAQIQNDQEVGMFDRSLERGNQFAKVGMTAPAALAVGPGAAMAGGVGRTLITGATTAAAGGAIGGAYGAGRKEAEITLDAMRNPDPEKGRWDTWIDKNREGFPAMQKQAIEYAGYGTAFGAAMATPLGRPLATSAGMLGVAEGATNTADNLMKSTSATGSDKIKNQNEAFLSMADTAFAGFGSRALLRGQVPGSNGGAASPAKQPNMSHEQIGQSAPTNPRELNLGPKNRRENTHKNPNKPVEGQTIPESGQIFGKAPPSSLPQNLPRPKIEVKWNQDGTRTVQTGGHDRKNNYRIKSKEYHGDGMYARSESIIKGTPDKSVSSLNFKKYPGRKPTAYSYEKIGADGTVQSSRVNDGQGNITRFTSEKPYIFEGTSFGKVPIKKETTRMAPSAPQEASTKAPVIAEAAKLPSQGRQRTYDDGGRIISGSNISRNTDGSLRSSVTKKPDGSLQGVRSLKNEGGSVLKNIDAQGATTLRKKWSEGPTGEISVNTKYPQTGREKVDSINAVLPGQETGGRLSKPVSDSHAPTKTSQLPDHLKKAAKPEPVKTNEKTPQNPSTPPEKLKDITLDPDELIRKRSLKK